MKRSSYIVLFVLVLSATLLGACSGAPSVISSAGSKVEAAQVAFTGVIEAMNGTHWVVNGQTITVDPTLMRGGSFTVGETVKVEAQVGLDGSLTVTRVESQVANDMALLPTSEIPSGTRDDHGSDAVSAPAASSTSGAQSGLVIDNSGNEAFGSVDAVTANTITIGGQTFSIGNGAEFKNQIAAGDFVKVHFILNADGTLSITEIQAWDPALVRIDDNSTDHDVSDDRGQDAAGHDANDDHDGDSGHDGSDDH